MKTEEQFLLNYMYKEGCTDEEMHDAAALKVMRNSVSFRMKYAQYIFKEIAAAALKAFKEWMAKLISNFGPVSAGPLGKSPVFKNEQSLIPITLPDQVIDRNPHHLVKKIIR